MKKIVFISLIVLGSVGYVSAADTEIVDAEIVATAEELTAEELKDLAAQIKAVKFRDSRKAARTAGTRLAPPAPKRPARRSRTAVGRSSAAVDLFPERFETAVMADALAEIDFSDQGMGAGQEDAGAGAVPTVVDL